MTSSDYPISLQPTLLPPGPGPASKRTWLIWILVTVSVMVIAAGLFGLLFFVASLIRNSEPFKVALQRANDSPEVAAAIGKPLKVGWMISGQINYNGTEGNAQMTIPISGPKGRGTIVISATRHANRWTFQTLEVYVEGQQQPIPLMEPQAPTDSSSPTTMT